MVQSLEFLERSWNFPELKKSGKKVKSLEFFFFLFFFKATIKNCFRSEVLSFWSISYSISPVCFQCTMKKVLFLRLRSLLITYLLTLSLEKKITFLEKGLGKVLNFGSKNLYEPCSPLSLIILWSRLILSSTSVYT